MPGVGSRFSDVEAGVWWEPYVERLAVLGVTAGCATDPLQYCPKSSVTRGQMATFFSRAYGLAAAGSAGFADTGGNTHEASIDALYGAGITAGCGTDPLQYCPQKSVTRAQIESPRALRTDGDILCWGANLKGGFLEGPYTTVTMGGYHVCANRPDGTIYCDGQNFLGQLNIPDTLTGPTTDDEPPPDTTPPPTRGDTTISAGFAHSCGVRADGTAVCWGWNDYGQADAPSGSFAQPTEPRPAVTVSKGDPGPTILGPGLGVPCAPDTPTCRYLNIQLTNVDPGAYTVACSHDGWNNIPASTWWTLTATVGADRSATITRQCFINFADLTGDGAYVTVTGPGGDTVTSNSIK